MSVLVIILLGPDELFLNTQRLYGSGHDMGTRMADTAASYCRAIILVDHDILKLLDHFQRLHALGIGLEHKTDMPNVEVSHIGDMFRRLDHYLMAAKFIKD